MRARLISPRILSACMRRCGASAALIALPALLPLERQAVGMGTCTVTELQRQAVGMDTCTVTELLLMHRPFLAAPAARSLHSPRLLAQAPARITTTVTATHTATRRRC